MFNNEAIASKFIDSTPTGFSQNNIKTDFTTSTGLTKFLSYACIASLAVGANTSSYLEKNLANDSHQTMMKIVLPHNVPNISSNTNDRMKTLETFAINLIDEQHDIPPEFEEVFRENFFALLSRS